MNYLPEFLTVALIHLLAVMSPGPDFAMISRSALVYSRKTGLYSAVGLGIGITVHVTYSLVGIGFIIAQSILLFTIIKLLGAGYLIYIGYKSLRSKPRAAGAETTVQPRPDLTPLAAVKMGFLTNVLNPKATMFFLALFTQVINPKTPLLIQLGYGIEMTLMTITWFSLVATILSLPAIKTRFSRYQHYLEKFFGVILIGLGIKVALSKSH